MGAVGKCPFNYFACAQNFLTGLLHRKIFQMIAVWENGTNLLFLNYDFIGDTGDGK